MKKHYRIKTSVIVRRAIFMLILSMFTILLMQTCADHSICYDPAFGGMYKIIDMYEPINSTSNGITTNYSSCFRYVHINNISDLLTYWNW